MVLPSSDLLKRTTIDADSMHGRPSIRGLRVTVADILGLMSAGQSREAILQDYPYLADTDPGRRFSSTRIATLAQEPRQQDARRQTSITRSV
jgi:uncharacterized protein (DUF433 family)